MKIELDVKSAGMIVFGLIAIVAMFFTFQMWDETKKLQTPEAFVQNYCHNKQSCVDYLNANYVSNSTWKHHNMILNATLTAIESDLQKAGIALTVLQNKFIIVEHTGDIPTTTPDSLAKCAADFNMQTMGIDGQFRERFESGEVIFIRGDYKEGIPGNYKITKGGQTVATSTVTTATDGSFLGRFNEAQNEPTGQYTAEFQLDGLSDCVSFYLE